MANSGFCNRVQFMDYFDVEVIITIILFLTFLTNRLNNGSRAGSIYRKYHELLPISILPVSYGIDGFRYIGYHIISVKS